MSSSIIEINLKKIDQNIMTPMEIQEHALRTTISMLSREDQDKVQTYVDRFIMMINKGGAPVQIAFTVVGLEMSKQG